MTSVPARATRTWASGPGLLLAAIVAVGALLRFWGILHGLREGYLYHPDAPVVVREAWDWYLGGPEAGRTFGPVYHFLLGLTMRAIDGAGGFVGYPLGWSSEGIASAASLLGATLGTATIGVVYVLGARAYAPSAGLLAAALLSVCPLHTFQSHYPYRDVPMVFFLTLTLVACVVMIERPTISVFALAGLAALTTAALKPAGFVVMVPLLVAAAIALYRARRPRLVLAIVALAALVWAALAFLPERTILLAGFRGSLWRSVVGYFAEYAGGFGPGVANASQRLVEWLGVPYVVAVLAGVGYGLWRRRASDLVLLGFLLPAFVATAINPFLDERFLVFLLPAAAVLLGRAVVEGWDAGARARPVRALLATAAAGLFLLALGQSAWQGMLLSLPDTRFLAGRWLEAHLPKSAKVAVEGYYPLGMRQWPNTSFFDPRQPFPDEVAKVEVLVTSSRGHQRYFDFPDRYPAQVAFFQALARQARPIKTFALGPVGFIHPTIEVYATRSLTAEAPPRLVLPRPYDASWNAGVSFLDGGPYDRDDRTIRLEAARGYRATLVARAPTDEIAVFVLNGSEPGRVRVRVGWQTTTRMLQPGELRVFQFRPRWLVPVRPVLYAFEAQLLPPPTIGRDVLVQVRSGPREIGEAYAGWGRWGAAVSYLERAAAAGPADAETHFLLAAAYRESGRTPEARRTVERLVARDPGILDRYRRLAQAERSPGEWADAFRALTGLDATLLTSALAQELEAESLPVEAGRVVGDPDASGGLSVAFDRQRDRSGVVVNGPPMTLFLARGAYRARFFLRPGAGAARAGTVAVVKAFAEARLLASRPVTLAELAGGRPFAQVPLPFVHTEPAVRVAVEVEATGLASLAVDRIRIEPDLREGFRQRARLLATPVAADRSAGTP